MAAGPLWIHLSIQEDRGRATHVQINLPVTALERALPLIPTDAMHRCRIEVESHEIPFRELAQAAASLRGAPEGAEVEVLVVMGGLEVIVPDDWTVINDVQAVMGAVEDDRKSVAPVGTSTLRLKGFVMMGGVEIKNG